MRRPLLVLALLLVVVVGADTALRRSRQAGHRDHGSLRALVDPARQIVPERVRRLRLGLPGAGVFVYERRGDAWRFPAYFDAYAQSDRLDQLLRLLTASGGTLASTDADVHDDLGVTERQAVRFDLEGTEGPLVAILVGRGIPGPGGDESYVRLAASDTVIHLHANPRLLIGAGQPPMLDPSLLPRATAGGAIVEASVRRGSDDDYRLRRVDAPVPAAGPPLPLAGAERYRWVLERSGRIDTCVDASVSAWMGGVRTARFARLVDPAADGYGLGTAGRLTWIDDKGARAELLVGVAAGADEVYVANTGAGLVTVTTAATARRLTPPAAALLDSTFLREALPP